MDVSFAPPPYRDSLRPVRDLLATLLPELQRDLGHAEIEHGDARGLVVMTHPRPDDLLLYDLGGAAGALHAACPLFMLRSVALHYAPAFVRTLWQSPAVAHAATDASGAVRFPGASPTL